VIAAGLFMVAIAILCVGVTLDRGLTRLAAAQPPPFILNLSAAEPAPSTPSQPGPESPPMISPDVKAFAAQIGGQVESLLSSASTAALASQSAAFSATLSQAQQDHADDVAALESALSDALTPKTAAAPATAPQPREVSIVVSSDPIVGTVGAPLGGQFQATGGVAPYSFAASGAPADIAIAADGTISGTPDAAESGSLTVTATDANGATGSAEVAYTIT
jgi:hypothetical protein